MAEIVKTEGLVIAYEYNGNVYPLACSKNSSITINSEFYELAPKTNNIFREYIINRKTFSISGSGLVKLSETSKHPFDFFNNFMLGTDDKFIANLDIIDSSNNYAAYSMNCYISSLTLDSTFGANPSYSFSLQGSGALTLLTEDDTYTVSSGKITGRNTSTYKLVAIGYGGKWYYNYVVTNPSVGVYEISMGTALNGTSVKAIYKAL